MKWDFYAMNCARRVGDDAVAWSLAETVESQSTTPAGLVVSPMRFAEAQLTKAASKPEPVRPSQLSNEP